jgi:negative regulator of flagellin synthesis FlgM
MKNRIDNKPKGQGGETVMRIESYNKIAGLYQPARAKRTKDVQSVGGKDEVQISQAGRDFQIAKQAVKESSDVREEKVAQMKAQVNSGEYKVDPGDFDKKLLDKYNAYR